VVPLSRFRVAVRSGASVDAAVEAAVAGLDGLDGLVTVVGGQTLFASWKPLHETSDDEWQLSSSTST
jgi:NAD(P)-dependent dehydrogenase (short-subunit alcohol dehydrogenase family)